ncbi:LytR C-terminal domain-containing protein [candidate division WOR-3 bacterium]|nr:LytR C-terminal domain-containing protein [candidate division WOR-3 bacterium]
MHNSNQPNKKAKIGAFVLLLAGIFSIIYLISTGENFIRSRTKINKKLLSQIRVEVLNGTSISGLAERTADFLREKGFDVVDVGSANEKIEATVILDRADRDLRNARLVRRVLRQGRTSFEPHPLQLLEISLVLGSDFKERRQASILERR